MAAYSGPVINTAGLIALYSPANLKSYPGTGTTLYDLTGNNNNANLAVSPTFSNVNNGIFTFNGSSQYIYSPSFSTTLNFGFSLGLWFNATANGMLLSEQGTAVYETVWHNSYMEIVSGVLHIGFWTGTQANVALSAISFGVWYYAVMTYNLTTLSGYINGNFINSSNLTKQNPNTNTTYIGIGCNEATNMGSGAWYNGSIADFEIYNTVLTPIQIQQNFNALRGRYNL